MLDKPLNFNPGDLGAFDSAADPGEALAAFDSASGVTVLPAGWYTCRLESGELHTTKAGKLAYRLRFTVVEPAEHAAFSLWRYFTLADPANANRAKAALASLGLRSGADLRRAPFPEAGRVIVCNVLVGVQKDDPTRNDVMRFTVTSDERDNSTAAARFAVPSESGTEGGNT
ncbi:unnamed protein product [Gemmata massiliana]|uniref:Uncharacterized protein n=1 Tax=Gemmata massiliana TaxID=1210884 RepID=A0A6P2CRZ1_9BACT|nr:hypothetical protein [Gemmata massiliana]VTR91693.1 unnamed protein product [Gemmata massiliana]